jgi:VWFA-related protein
VEQPLHGSARADLSFHEGIAMRARRAVGLTVAGLLLAVRTLPAQDYRELVDVNVVTVDVEVRDRQGRPVTDLQRGDFQVFEDGRRVELTNFERVSRPVTAAPAEETGAPAADLTLARSTPSPAEATSHVAVYVDNVHLRAATRTRALRQVRDLLAGADAGERVMVAAQGKGGVEVRLPFSSDRAAIAAALDQVDTLSAHGHEVQQERVTAVQAIVAIQRQNIMMGSPCAHNILQPVQGFAEAVRQQVRGTLRQLTFLVNSLAGIPGRKALVYVSDGIPLQPGQELFEVLHQICGGGAATSGLGYTSVPGKLGGAIPVPSEGGFGIPMLDATGVPGAYQARSAALDAASYDLTAELRRLAAHASAHRVSLYALQASGLAPPAGDGARVGEEGLLSVPAVASSTAENAKDPLVYLAHETGGHAIIDTNDFRRELGRMREGLATYYSLGYTPSHQGDGNQHAIDVKVKRPGVRLAYRRTYRDKPALEEVADRVLAALLHGVEDNPLEVKVEMSPPQPLPDRRQRVTARLLVPLFKLATVTHEESYAGKLRVMVIVGEPGGGRSALRQIEVPLRVPRAEVLTAFGKSFAYDVGLELAAGAHTLAFGVRDELGGTTSYLRRAVAPPPEPRPAIADN